MNSQSFAMLSAIKSRFNLIAAASKSGRQQLISCGRRQFHFSHGSAPAIHVLRNHQLADPLACQVRHCANLPQSGHLHVEKGESSDLDSVTVPASIVPQVKEFWQKNSMKIEGRDAPMPIFDFESLDNISPELLDKIKSFGFEKPTPIQSQCWPIALAGRDVVGIAQTGSGKTLAYVLPAIMKIQKIEETENYDYRDPLCLILAPTRELAQQIQSVAEKFSKLTRAARSVCFFGGASKSAQVELLGRHKPPIVIATPGRLLDIMRDGYLNMSKIRFLVLDEADRMLDMGFEPQVREICRNIKSENCQTMMWSATWPEEVKSLAAQFLDDYVQIVVGGTELTVNSNIEQKVEILEAWEKHERLENLLQEINPKRGNNKTLIFAATQARVEHLVSKLNQMGYRAKGLHGKKTQRMRDMIMSDFRSGICSILVATDVAARGLDVKDIEYVINFDFPMTHEDYIHRIGRTGRVEKKGIAYTFLTEKDASYAKELVEILERTNAPVPPRLKQLVTFHAKQKSDKYRQKRADSRSYRQVSSSRNSGRNSQGKFNFLFDEEEEEMERDRRMEQNTRPRSRSYDFETRGRSKNRWEPEFNGRDGWHPDNEEFQFK